MEPMIPFLIILAVCSLLSGPIALIVAIIAISKANRIEGEISRGVVAGKEVPHREMVEIPKEIIKPAVAAEQPFKKAEAGISREAAEFAKTVTKPAQEKTEGMSLEQRIGTKWVLVAGVITLIFCVGFFLKYAYDNGLVGPMGRVVIATISGLAALVIGEVTRKRGYGIVAKGVTALGFAILYAAVFSAYRFYGLIGPMPGFGLAILITAAGMFYAVSLDEIEIALLALLGGFLTPVIVSTGENLPVPLFTYVLILGTGGMICAYYRKWRAVNLLVFAGTFLLYTGWFEKFYRPAMTSQTGTTQMGIALLWLGVFSGVYLVLPLFYELVRKVKANKEDVMLVIGNAAVTFYYLWTILFGKYRIGACVLRNRALRGSPDYDECGY